MESQRINASPTKAFFIQNLTRDLALEDAILDLVDNSIDSAAHLKRLDVSAALLKRPPESASSKISIRIEVGPDRISVVDEAAGIDPERVANDVFRLGRMPGGADSTLGVYGIGMKRAVFKIGRQITVTSWHKKGGFRVRITPEWLDDESDWKLPLEVLPGNGRRGTEVLVEKLRAEICMRVEDPGLLKRLRNALSETYGLFLDHLVHVTLNDAAIESRQVPLGQSAEVQPGKKLLKAEGVEVVLHIGLQPRIDSRWEMEKAGWYVLCNGRVVVFADRTELTGWGVVGPQFTPKYRGFVGVAFFFSEDPSQLPWTTTKRGLNRESKVYQLARREMAGAARPVLTFLNNMYPSDVPDSEIEERRLADTVEAIPLHKLASLGERSFQPPMREIESRPVTTSVQFTALKSDIVRAKKCLGKSRWGANKVGAYALKYFLEQECPE